MTIPKPDPEAIRHAVRKAVAKAVEAEEAGRAQPLGSCEIAWGEPIASGLEAFREMREEIDRHVRETAQRRIDYLEDLCRQMVEDGTRGILLFDYQKLPPAADMNAAWARDETLHTEWVLQGQLSDLVPYGQIYEVRSDPEAFIADRGLERLVDEAEQRRHDARPVPASWHVPASGVLPDRWSHYCRPRSAYTHLTYGTKACDRCPAKAPLRPRAGR